MWVSTSEPILRAVEVAAARLHSPGFEHGDVLDCLERSVVELGLADRAAFIPAVLGPGAPLSDAEELELIGVRRPDGTEEGWLRCHGISEDAVWPVRVLAAHAGAAIDALNRLHEVRTREHAQRQISEELQDALLPDIPKLHATSIAVRYRPAAAEARVGGDFYDVFELPDGRVLLVVGDVVGKGIEAASRTSRITHTLRTLALSGLDLDALLSDCDRFVTHQDADIMATVWCGLYEPASGELRFASLGHPPALLLRSDQEALQLTLEGLPMGLRDLSPDPPELRTRLLTPRDLLVLYTDGVVEAHGDLVAGQEQLLAAVSRGRDEPLADLVTGALDEMLCEAGHRDDAVMLALRRR